MDKATHPTFGRPSASMSRRTFVEWAAVLGGGCALAGSVPVAALADDAAAAASGEAPEPPAAEPFDYDKIVWSGCHVNCGSRCPLKMYVKDDTVVRVGIDDDGSDVFGPGEIYQMRSCVRGRTNRQRLYNDSRIQTPLRRVKGTKRGEGKYEAISWEEAIDEIASAMVAIKEKYGNDAFYIQYGTGQLGGTVSKSWAPDNTMFARLLNCFGGYLRHYCDYSTGQINWELPLFNGDAYSNNEVTDLVNSKNIVLFGNNPANTRMSGSAMQYLITQVRLQNPEAKIVVVDPILSDTAVGVANQWIPIKPGTDMALIAGMVYYLHTNGKLDEQFVRDNFIGFYSDTFLDEVAQGEPPSNAFFGYDKSGTLTVDQDMSYEAYLMGTGAYEGTGEKTPEWAASITGVPAQTIVDLAELYLDGPTATIQGWGPQRHQAGGYSARAIGMIAALTKNVGISGGGTGAREATGGVGYPFPAQIPNLVEKNTVTTCVSFFDWYHAIEDYQSMNDATWGVRNIDNTGAMTYAEEPGTVALKAPIKFIWNYASNVMMGQHGDINEMLRLYNLPDEDDSGLTMVVTDDVYMTPTAMISDIILPGTTAFEETDIITGGSAWTGFALCEEPAVAPLFEAKPVYEICCLLAEKLGVVRRVHRGAHAGGLGRVALRPGRRGRRRPALDLRGVQDPAATSSRPTTTPPRCTRSPSSSPRPRASGRSSPSRRTTSPSSGTSPAAATCPTTAWVRSIPCPSSSWRPRARATRPRSPSTPTCASASTRRPAPTRATATSSGSSRSPRSSSGSTRPTPPSSASPTATWSRSTMTAAACRSRPRSRRASCPA